MLSFTNEPPEDPRGQPLPLVRTPAMKPLCGIITSSEMIGTRTHFFKGRTLPCDDTSCPACDEGSPWRWHGYVALYGLISNRQVLFEFTARAAEPLKTYMKAYGSLRGCHLIAKRANSSPNSQVHITTKPADLEKIALPDGPNLMQALGIIWNLDRTAMKVSGLQKDVPSIAVNSNRETSLDMLKAKRDYDAKARANGNGSAQ